MPLEPLVKNKGPLLITKIRGGVDDFPQEFVAALGKDIYVQEVPVDVQPDELTDFLIESRVVQERTNERKKSNTYFGGFGPNGSNGNVDDILAKCLNQDVLLPDGQIGLRRRCLVREGTHLTANELTVDGNQRNLGNGWLEQIVTTRPTVFPQTVYGRSRATNIPPDFGALLQEKTLEQTLTGSAGDPTLEVGDIERRDSQTDVFIHRLLIRNRDLASLPVFMANLRTNQFKQVETVTRLYELDTATPSPVTATRDVNFTRLGDGTAVEERIDIPSVFPRRVRSTELPDLVPVEFRAFLKTHRSEDTIIASITDPPVLGSGEFVRTEAEQDLFTIRRSTTSRDAVTLPFSISGNKRTNRYKQVETITHTLESEGTTPALPSSTRDVTFTKLGNGQAVEEWVDVPVVFGGDVSSIEIPNVIPLEFRSAVPITVYEHTAAGTVTVPQILGAGEFSRSEEQVDTYNFRRKISTIGAVTFPQSLFGSEVTSEYGGGIATILRTLDDSDITPASGLNIISSVTRQLAPNLYHNETKGVAAAGAATWPTLVSWEFDPEIQGYIKKETQVVDPSYAIVTGTYFIETLKALDKWKSQRTRITKQPTATGEPNAIIWYEYRPFQFPGYLDYERLMYYDHHEGYRKVSAQLCKHWIRTWWVVGTLPAVAVDDIILDTVNIPVFEGGSSPNQTLAQEYPNVIHDEFTNSLGAYYPATTPTMTEYVYGTPDTSTTTIDVFILSAPGTGYSVGNTITLLGHNFTVLQVNPTDGGVIATSQPSVPHSNRIVSSSQSAPTATTGGSGTGCMGILWTVAYRNFIPGTSWIGSEKIVSAKVEKTEVPNLWKITTETVVMR